MNSLHKKLKLIKWFFTAAFLSISLYLLIFNFAQAKYVYSNSYNKRLRNNNQNIIRGDIRDRNDTILVSSKINNNGVNRKYEYGRHFSHVIGYHSQKIGSTGIEAFFDKVLSSANIINIIRNKIDNKHVKGNTIKLTIDKNLQVFASELLDNKKGSLVALNPKTGEILALVSKPDFNPSKIDSNWNNLVKDENSPLLNRAIDGLYPPGSIFKIITTSAALYSGYKDYEIQCSGSISVDGYEIKDSSSDRHGTITLDRAFALSCNSYYVSLGLKLGNENLYKEAVKFKFNKKLTNYLASKTSSYNKNDSDRSLALQSIGQGDVLITPIHAAAIAAIIANDGV
ncbi:MAG: penicillin-binding protein A, partial [Clostridiales bacterium]|nr:penicillin-binding protein A [Clostridiales bacterium]